MESKLKNTKRMNFLKKDMFVRVGEMKVKQRGNAQNVVLQWKR